MRGPLLFWASGLAALSTVSCAIIASLGDRTLGTFDDAGTELDGTTPDGSLPPDGATSNDGGVVSDVVTPPFDAPPGCVIGAFPATLLEAQIYLAVDTSGSMMQPLPEAGTRYQVERGAVDSFVADPLSAGVYAMAGTHPDQGAEAGCTSGPFATPPVPMGRLGGGTGAAITTFLAPLGPLGQSPWSAMITGALQATKAAKVAAPARETAFVFIADSTPTACLMTAAEIESIVAPYAQGTPPIRTFFVGITEMPSDVIQFMNPIAQVGGTDAAFAQVPPTPASMLAALVSIRDELACLVRLPLVGGKPADLTKGLLYLETSSAQLPTAGVANAAACTAADEWYPAPTNDRVHLCPKACNRLLADGTIKPFVAACAP